MARATARTPGGRGRSSSPTATAAGEPAQSPMDPECTFAPKLVAYDAAHPVKSRYLDPVAARGSGAGEGGGAAGGAGAAAGGSLDAECTFAPRINPVQPSRMPAAAFYVRADIYERLSRTNTKSQVEREKAVHEDLQRIEVAHREKLGVRAPEAEAGSGSGGAGSGLPEMSEEESRRLQDFLRRQEAAARKKGERLEELVQATAPIGQPSLCDKSLRIVKEKAGEASFLQRLQTSFYDKHHEVRCPRHARDYRACAAVLAGKWTVTRWRSARAGSTHARRQYFP